MGGTVNRRDHTLEERLYGWLADPSSRLVGATFPLTRKEVEQTIDVVNYLRARRDLLKEEARRSSLQVARLLFAIERAREAQSLAVLEAALREMGFAPGGEGE